MWWPIHFSVRLSEGGRGLYGLFSPWMSLESLSKPSPRFDPPPSPPSPGNRDQSGPHSVSSTAWLKLKELVGQQDCDVIRCRNKIKIGQAPTGSSVLLLYKAPTAAGATPRNNPQGLAAQHTQQHGSRLKPKLEGREGRGHTAATHVGDLTPPASTTNPATRHPRRARRRGSGSGSRAASG